MAQAAFSFELSGIKETLDALEQLPTIFMKKTVLRNALKKAGKPIAGIAMANCPYDAQDKNGKHLRDTIKVSTSLKASQRHGRFDRSVVTVYVGLTSPLAHLLEFGTGPRYNKNGAFRGQVSPNPFMRKAWDSEKKSALDIFGKEIWIELAKAAKRLAKRAGAGKLSAGQIAGLR